MNSSNDGFCVAWGHSRSTDNQDRRHKLAQYRYDVYTRLRTIAEHYTHSHT